jgi:hypothetical protein
MSFFIVLKDYKVKKGAAEVLQLFIKLFIQNKFKIILHLAHVNMQIVEARRQITKVK